jgi:tRNA-dihydrouridine synthase B
MKKIGNLVLENPFLMAPLAGITDSPFRRLVRRQGASLVYSEMISGKGLYYGDRGTEILLHFEEEEKPVGYQIFGSEPEVMAFAARKLASGDSALLDINMGCPVPKVVKNGEGCALMKDPGLAFRLVEAAVQHSGKPVTVKMRLGWDEDSVNCIEVARAVEMAGASAVAVHGRTRDQFYSGKARWKEISEVKKALRIPVIGNGDLFSGQDALRMLEETGVDYVMIARGALGNPWIFRECVALWKGNSLPDPPTLEEKKTTMLQQLSMLVEMKGVYSAIREMRKHVGWYVKGIPGAGELKRKVNTIIGLEELERFIQDIGMGLEEGGKP